jgi:hypothetical protein
MKIIITEEQNTRLRVLRRLSPIDDLVDLKLRKYDNMIKTNIAFGLCDENEQYFYLVVKQWVIEQMYYSYFGDIDDSSDEWEEIYNIMEKYLDSNHKDYIKDFFISSCR